MAEGKQEQAEEKKPQWVSLKNAEIEKIVTDLGKQGELPAKIGLILRDKYGVPKDRIAGKKITKILENAGISYKKEEDLAKERIKSLEKHIERNVHDYTAKRSLTKKLWLVKNS